MNQLEPQIKEEDYILDNKKGLFKTILGMFYDNQKIGEINGKWAFMLKAVLLLFFVCVPTFFGWATWVTKSTWDNTSRIEIIKENITLLPPPTGCAPTLDWQRRIENLEVYVENTGKDIKAIEKLNSDEHRQILIMLEGIKTKVELISTKQNE